jgi:beta-glucosidase
MSRLERRYSLGTVFLGLLVSTLGSTHPSPTSFIAKKWVQQAAVVATAAWWTHNAYAYHTPLKWDWTTIDVTDTDFPSDFCWGASSSSQQVEGHQARNNWFLWQHYKADDPDFVPAGIACNFWQDHSRFIDTLKKAGLNSFRMSLEWARIEPQEGVFDQEALDRYKQICKDFHDAGISLFVTLHHYTEPLWFSDTDYDHGQDITPGLGGFSKLENVHYFARYAAKVVEVLHPYVHRWATFNNLTSFAVKGYHTGALPPGIKDNMQSWQCTQAYMLEAHVQAYNAMKQIKPNASVGILHNVFNLEPARPWHPLDRLAVHMAHTLHRDGVYNFFKTGRYKVWIPTKVSVDHCNEDAPSSLDWVGCNNYSHGWMKNFKVSRVPGETPVDNPLYTVYPEGMYRAIKEVSEHIARPCGDIPIIVTENGVSTSDEGIRKLFFERYLYAMHKARQEGCNVIGYLPWTLVDNYEWGTYKKSYGFYPFPGSSLRSGGAPVLDTARTSLSE